jgi:hypothetical protein
MVAFRFWPSTAHDEVMGHSCERCGRPGNLCSIEDPTAFVMLKSLNLCVQCYAAIRQMDVRACKWFRRYCTFFRHPRTPIFTANQSSHRRPAREDRQPAIDKESSSAAANVSIASKLQLTRIDRSSDTSRVAGHLSDIRRKRGARRTPPVALAPPH